MTVGIETFRSRIAKSMCADGDIEFKAMFENIVLENLILFVCSGKCAS